MNRFIKIIFLGTVVSFIVVAAEIFVPFVQDFMQGKVFLVPIFIFAFVSSILVWSVWKSDIHSRPRLFLLISGVSGFGFMLCTILHNVFYALSMITKNIVFLKYFFEMLHVTFFLVGIIGCPIAFFVGVGGSLWFMINKEQK